MRGRAKAFHFIKGREKVSSLLDGGSKLSNEAETETKPSIYSEAEEKPSIYLEAERAVPRIQRSKPSTLSKGRHIAFHFIKDRETAFHFHWEAGTIANLPLNWGRDKAFHFIRTQGKSLPLFSEVGQSLQPNLKQGHGFHFVGTEYLAWAEDIPCKKRLPIFPSPAGMSLTRDQTLPVEEWFFIPLQGEFGQWHPAWGRKKSVTFFTVYCIQPYQRHKTFYHK
jgi:hypothetical protein